jgi:hypothetical protein
MLLLLGLSASPAGQLLYLIRVAHRVKSTSSVSDVERGVDDVAERPETPS